MGGPFHPTAPTRPGHWRTARAWLGVLVWASLVWVLGGDRFSAVETARFLRPLVEAIVPDFTIRDMYVLLYSIRKAAHVSVYGFLALLTLRALWIGSVRSLVLSLSATGVFVAAVALADETRQAYSSVRTGSGTDVVFDLAGATGVVLITLAIQARRRRPLFSPLDASPDGGSR